MRVLFFVNSLGNGGAERVCINLANVCTRNGYKVDFITLFRDDDYDGIQDMHLLCLGIDKKAHKFSIIGEIIANRKKINLFIKENEMEDKYSLITAHLPLSHICAAVSGKRDVCLYIQHTSLKAEGRYFNLYKNFYRNRVNVCVSKGLAREFITEIKCSMDRVDTIYNPILLETIRDKIGEPVYFDRPYLLCVGRLNSFKRFDRAIEIFYKGGFYKEYALVILGQGELQEALEKTADRYGIGDHVYFMGWQRNVYAWMHHASLLYQTSDKEAFPMVLIEALASGTRVVAGNYAYGADEILLGDLAGYIADIKNIDDYISKIKMALADYPVSQEYDILQSCSGETVLMQYLELYARKFGNQ